MFGLKILVGTLFFIMVTGGGLITSLDAQGAVTGETSMTVVNVDNWQTPDKSNWYAERVYINHVDIVGYQHIAWSMTPYPLPFRRNWTASTSVRTKELLNSFLAGITMAFNWMGLRAGSCI